MLEILKIIGLNAAGCLVAFVALARVPVLAKALLGKKAASIWAGPNPKEIDPPDAT